MHRIPGRARRRDAHHFRPSQQRAKLLDPGEFLALAIDLTRSERNVYLCLLAHNRVHFPHLGYKWTRTIAEGLAEARDELAALQAPRPVHDDPTPHR